MRYYIGIDGGGTKTAICAVNEEDFSTTYVQTSGSSWREHGTAGVAQLLRSTVYELIGEGHIAAMAMGLPCYTESVEGDRELEDAIHQAFQGVPIYLANDVEVGWAGSLALQPGINIVAGTGSIAFGKDANGKTVRCGGWSEFFGDEGSCYWIGRRVLEMFSKQADNRIPKDALYNIVCEEFKLANIFDIIDIIHSEYLPYRERIAGLQLLAKRAALAGSGSAMSLYREAVDELCMLVDSIRSQLDFGAASFTVSYTGGLYKAGEIVLSQFSREIARRGGVLAIPRLKAEEGAALLAFESFCPELLETARESLLNPT